MNRDGKGVYEEESRKPTLGFFFKLLFRKFSKLLRLNLLMLFQIIPIMIFVFVYFAGFKTPTATSILHSPLYGITQTGATSTQIALLDLNSIQMGIPLFTPAIVITLTCLAVFLVLTYGWQNVGAAYVLRGLVRGDAVFIFSDFFYAIKRNFKQAFFMGLLDALFTIVLVADFLFFYQRTGAYGFDVMFFVIFALAVIYLFMRFYIYQLMITFNLSIFKIIKNALIFTVLGIKRNLMALLGLVVLIALQLVLIFMLLPYGISIPLVLPLVYFMAVAGFIQTYAAYPIIDRYMIAPFAKQPDVAEDDGTEDIN